MTATLAQPARRQERQERTEAVERQPYRLRLTPDVARQLGRYVSPIVARVRTEFEDRRETDPDGPDRITIDLAGAPTVPASQLILLVTLLRHAIGNGVQITLSGVTPAIMGSLVTFDTPPDVVLIDSRGRRWAG
jgi:hypothetical protein